MVFLLSKAYQSVFIYFGQSIRRPDPPGGWEGVSNWLLNPWTTFDSKWYLDIAANGYREISSVFFPLYPLLLRICGDSEISRALAGIIISNLAFLLSLYVLYHLTRIDFSDEIARTVLWITAFFPTAAFFGAVYTESLFFLLLLLTFYAARRNKWPAAGIYGLLAGFTRNPAPVIFICLLLEYLRSVGYKIKRIKLIPVLCITSVLSGLILFNLYLYWRFGSFVLSVTNQRFYHRNSAWPWEPIINDTLSFFHSTMDISAAILLSLLAIALLSYYLIKYRRTFPPSYLFLVSAIVLANLCYPRNTKQTIATLRYVSVLFPFLQMLGLSYVEKAKNSKYNKYLLVTTYAMINALFSFWFGLKAFQG